MGTRSRIAIVLAAGAGLLASAAPAAAVSPPSCWNAAVWARPGTARTVELYCPRNEHAQVTVGPASSQLELLRSEGELLELRLTPTATAPEHESFTLRLSGPAGDADQVVQVHERPAESQYGAALRSRHDRAAHERHGARRDRAVRRLPR